jgi:hypothetical protein
MYYSGNKAKPAARRGRKATDLFKEEKTAGLPNEKQGVFLGSGASASIAIFPNHQEMTRKEIKE